MLQEIAMSFRRILIAVDGGPLAAHAAELGIELASSLGAEIAFVHAIDPGLSQAPGIAPNDLVVEDEREGKRLMAGFRQFLPPKHVPLEFIHAGKPDREIIRTAKEWPADVIVIGSHGRHGIQRALLGSVAEEVMRHAPCPVLVIRASR
jgi:nucleotide-binding universal stress UspA family protein